MLMTIAIAFAIGRILYLYLFSLSSFTIAIGMGEILHLYLPSLSSSAIAIVRKITMDTKEILALYDLDERINAAVPGMRREVDGRIVRLVMEEEAQGMSYISYSRFTADTTDNTDDTDGVDGADDVDEVIDRQVAYFQELGRPFEWTHYSHDRPADLGARLEAAGLKGDETGSLMVLELAEAPPRLLAPITADVRQVTDVSELETVRALLEAVWENPFAWFIPRMSRYLAPDGYVSIYIAYIDEHPASAAWVFLPEGSRFGGLFGGTTLEPYRGRGLYTALLAARIQEAVRRGYQFLHVDAGDMSQPIVAKQGFCLLVETTPYVWKPE
jgi:GNAT superfamily N-acetyltransferase